MHRRNTYGTFNFGTHNSAPAPSGYISPTLTKCNLGSQLDNSAV
jgi:hypothetical protein